MESWQIMSLQLYADFLTGVGQLAGKMHLEIDLSANSVQVPRWRLLVAITDRVKDKLDGMCKNGIIELVTESSLQFLRCSICQNGMELWASVSTQNILMPPWNPVPTSCRSSAMINLSALLTQNKVPIACVYMPSPLFIVHCSNDRDIFVLEWVQCMTFCQAKLHQKILTVKGVACIADDFLVYSCGDNVKKAWVNPDNHLTALLTRCKKLGFISTKRIYRWISSPRSLWGINWRRMACVLTSKRLKQSWRCRRQMIDRLDCLGWQYF